MDSERSGEAGEVSGTTNAYLVEESHFGGV